MEPGIHDLTAAYALDALDADERADYEAHLAGCAECREELASFSETTAALALAASGPAPTPALRERILGAAHAEPQNVVALTPRRSRLAPVLAATTAVAAAVAIALGAYALSLDGDLDQARDALSRQKQAAAVLADPAARTVALADGDGRLVVGSGGDAVLALSNLASLPDKSTYQAWVIRGGTPQPDAIFEVTDGDAVLALGGHVARDDVVAVTIEPAGGVDAPTSAPVVTSQPA
jgi:anti-sigma factor RsiW